MDERSIVSENKACSRYIFPSPLKYSDAIHWSNRYISAMCKDTIYFIVCCFKSYYWKYISN